LLLLSLLSFGPMAKKKTKSKARRARRGRGFGDRASSFSLAPQRLGYTSCVLRAGQIVPDRLEVPMKYAAIITINGSLGKGSYVFSQNSVYDPDVSSTGGTCAGFSTLSSLYGRWRVYSSRIHLTAQSDQADTMCVVAPGITNGGTGQAATSVAAYRHCKPRSMHLLPNNGAGPAVILQDSISTSELLGDALYDEADLYGVGSADPALQFYWTIGTNAFAAGSYSANFTVEIEYMVEWSMVKDLIA